MMTRDNWLGENLSLPVIVSPMFLASGPELVTQCCKEGIVGSFPALNQRTSEGFEQWLQEISFLLADFEQTTGKKPAPYGVNLVAHKSNPRLSADLALCVKYKVPLIITSLGVMPELITQVQGYGGQVYHDVTNVKFAQKAASAGVDGLILVCAGAGGHGGDLSPFALVNEVRQFFDKPLALSGSISTGSDIAAARIMGADMVYMGTRFLATQESMVNANYKQMLLEAAAGDIVYTPAVSGVPANFLRQSLIAAGGDPDDKLARHQLDIGTELNIDQDVDSGISKEEAKAWRDIWSAGQGVGVIKDLPSTAALISRLQKEYRLAFQQCNSIARSFK